MTQGDLGGGDCDLGDCKCDVLPRFARRTLRPKKALPPEVEANIEKSISSINLSVTGITSRGSGDLGNPTTLARNYQIVLETLPVSIQLVCIH